MNDSLREPFEDWRAAQHADESARIQETLLALAIAESMGTPHDVVQLLAYECGVGDLYKEQ